MTNHAPRRRNRTQPNSHIGADRMAAGIGLGAALVRLAAEIVRASSGQ
ncbi:hypothetical protein ACGFIW_01525 [Micromonospora sp. NPDC048935]